MRIATFFISMNFLCTVGLFTRLHVDKRIALLFILLSASNAWLFSVLIDQLKKTVKHFIVKMECR